MLEIKRLTKIKKKTNIKALQTFKYYHTHFKQKKKKIQHTNTQIQTKIDAIRYDENFSPIITK